MHSRGSGQDGGESDNDNDESLSGRGQTKGEAGGGHFRKGAWLSLCSAIDTPIPDEGSSDARAAQTFLKGALSPISEVLAGDFDLRVPVVTAVIDSYNKLSHSDVVVELVDPSGRMKGYLHPGCLEEHGQQLYFSKRCLSSCLGRALRGCSTCTRLAFSPFFQPTLRSRRLRDSTGCARATHPSRRGRSPTAAATPVNLKNT
ncbi:unnamed protein product [Laminaria digitata]